MQYSHSLRYSEWHSDSNSSASLQFSSLFQSDSSLSLTLTVSGTVTLTDWVWELSDRGDWQWLQSSPVHSLHCTAVQPSGIRLWHWLNLFHDNEFMNQWYVSCDTGNPILTCWQWHTVLQTLQSQLDTWVPLIKDLKRFLNFWQWLALHDYFIMWLYAYCSIEPFNIQNAFYHYFDYAP